MGVSKTMLLSEKENMIARYAKALGHPARVSIMEHMAADPTCTCNDLVREIGLSQPTISQHLKELRNIGLISSYRGPNRSNYQVDLKVWQRYHTELYNFYNRNARHVMKRATERAMEPA